MLIVTPIIFVVSHQVPHSIMSERPKTNQQEKEEQETKLQYLKGKYIFRYPFTLTSIKWATIMGLFFGAHAFVKKRNVKAAVEWGLWGTLLSSFPIWFFFMTKYSLYSHSIKKFQAEQQAMNEDAELRKKLIQIDTNNDGDNQEELFKVLTDKINQELVRNSELDFLLEGVAANSFPGIRE